MASAVKDLFNKWDADGNGYISEEELASCFGCLGWETHQVGTLLKAANVNNGLGIDYSEFISWIFDASESLPDFMVHRRPDRIPRTSLRSTADPSRSFCKHGCSVKDGEEVWVFPRQVVNGMVHVTGKDGEGWVKRVYLHRREDLKEDAPFLPPKMLHQRTDTITSTSLRSHADPDLSYCIHGQAAQNGEIVDVLPPRQVVNGMVQVLLQNGDKGWLRLKYLQELIEEAAERGRGVAGRAAIAAAAAAAAKRQNDACIIILDNVQGGKGAWYPCDGADGFRFSFAPGEYNDLVMMWVEKKDVQRKRHEEEDKFEGPEASEKLTEIGQYSIEEVLACIQKYQDGKVDEKYSGTWYMGDAEIVTNMLEEIKKVVRATDSDATGFHFDYKFQYYSTEIHYGDVFLVAGHLFQIEFCVFDQ